MEDQIANLISEHWQVGAGSGSLGLVLLAIFRHLQAKHEKLAEEMAEIRRTTATRTELNKSIASLRSEFNVRSSEIKSEIASTKSEIRQDLASMSSSITTQLGQTIEIMKIIKNG